MITIYYEQNCVLCTTNAIEIRAKSPDKIKITSVDNAIEELAKFNIIRAQAMTYVYIKSVDKSTGQETMHKGMDAIRLQWKVADMHKFDIRLSWVFALPIIRQMSNLIYPVVARNRYYIPSWLTKLLFGKVAEIGNRKTGGKKVNCDSGVCHIPLK